MSIRIVRLGSPRAVNEGLRLGTVRRPPRGVKKEALELDLWCKDVAPSPTLRKWFDHRADRFDEFAQRYRSELDANPAAVAELDQALGKDRATLVYGARDPAINHAVVLRDWLLAR